MTIDTPTNQEEIIDAYLLGKMTEEEKSDFEVRLLESTELLDALQIREAMIEELNTKEHSINSLRGAATESLVKGDRTLSSWIRQPLSIAASLIIAIGAVFQSTSILNDNSEQSLIQISDVPYVANFESYRGETNRADIARRTLPTSTPILFNIEVGTIESGNFTVSLISETTGEEAFSNSNLSLSEIGMLRVLLIRSFEGPHTLIVQSSELAEPLSIPLNFSE